MHRPPARGVPQPHLNLTLRYLVTSWSQKPAEAHRLLADLLFAAASNADYEVELGSPALEMWTPSRSLRVRRFVLRVPLRRDLTVRRAPLVRRPMEIEILPAGR